MNEMNELDNILAGVVSELGTEAPERGNIGQKLGLSAVEIGLHSRRVRRREFQDFSGQTAAAEQIISRLPEPGETLNFILDGSFVLASVVPVIVAHIGQPSALCLTTLGMNIPAAELFANMLRDKRLSSLKLALSSYFEAADHQTAHRAIAILKAQGAEVAISRVHIKTQLYCPAQGKDRYTLETSSNLRSANCIEGVAFSNDAGLFGWYDRWLSRFFERHRL